MSQPRHPTDPSTAKEGLMAARALIARGWTQHAAARTANGETLSPEQCASETAVCWCTFGALRAVGSMEADKALRTIIGGPLTEWNDDPDRTQAQVLAAFDKAIEALS